MRAIVHVGYHKTGTTFFQNHIYPQVANWQFVPRDLGQELFLYPRGLEFDSDATLRKLRSIGSESLIFCDEEFSGHTNNGGLHGLLSQEVARRFVASIPDCQFVVFLRNQIDMVASVYRQYVRAGGTYLPEYYIHHGEKHHRSPLFSFGHFDYDKLLNFYVDLVGPDRLKVYLYETFAADNLGFLQGFCNDLQLSYDLSGLPKQRSNVGYRKHTLSLARFLYRFTRERVLYKQHFVDVKGFRPLAGRLLYRLDQFEIMGNRQKSVELLGDTICQEIRARFAKGNAAIQEQFVLPLAQVGYPLPG